MHFDKAPVFCGGKILLWGKWSFFNLPNQDFESKEGETLSFLTVIQVKQVTKCVMFVSHVRTVKSQRDRAITQNSGIVKIMYALLTKQQKIMNPFFILHTNKFPWHVIFSLSKGLGRAWATCQSFYWMCFWKRRLLLCATIPQQSGQRDLEDLNPDSVQSTSVSCRSEWCLNGDKYILFLTKVQRGDVCICVKFYTTASL